MSESKASRTLVKSAPELWSEVSSAASLQRHMDGFGGIRITKLEPETAVAWEGEHARGTITLEQSGWGTKVSLTAEPAAADGNPTQKRAAEPATTGVPPLQAEDAEMRELTALFERDGPEASTQKGRRRTRLVETIRRWFGARPPKDAAAPDPEPALAEPALAHPAEAEPAEAHRAEAHPAEAEPAEAHPAEAEPAEANRAEPEPAEAHPVEAPPAGGSPAPEESSTAALNSALDSLGQAHHRPYSRA